MKIQKIIGAALLSLSACIWGGMFIVVKLVVGLVAPIELVWLRYLIAVFVLTVISFLLHEQWTINWRDLKLILLIGLIGNTLSIVSQETGTWLSNAQTGAVITSATPTFMLLFAAWLLKERLTKVRVLSISLATAGVIMIVGIHLTGKHVRLGVVALIIAALTWALMSVLIKRLSGTYSALQTTILSGLVAIICLTPAIILRRSVITQINFTNPTIVLCLLYLGVVSTALAFVMWNHGLRLVNASSSGLYFLLQPLVGTLLGWLLLHEAITWGFLFGAGLIILSVWISIRFDIG